MSSNNVDDSSLELCLFNVFFGFICYCDNEALDQAEHECNRPFLPPIINGKKWRPQVSDLASTAVRGCVIQFP